MCEDPSIGSNAAFGAANVQLELCGVRRSVGHRILPADVGTGNAQLDVLPGVEGQRFIEVYDQPAGLASDGLENADGAHDIAQRVADDAVVGDVGQRFDQEIGARCGLAGESDPVGTFLAGEDEFRGAPVI